MAQSCVKSKAVGAKIARPIVAISKDYSIYSQTYRGLIKHPIKQGKTRAPHYGGSDQRQEGGTMTNTQWIEKHGKTAQGKREYLDYLTTRKKLTPRQAIRANCYQCAGYYFDGKIDCEVIDCPLRPYMPYAKDKPKTKRAMSEKQREAAGNLNRRSTTRRTANADNAGIE